MTVNTDTIRKNLLRIKREVNRPIMLMTKANAYGHGLCEVAKATEDIVDMFGVVCFEEGVALKECGVGKDVLVCACEVERLKDAQERGLVLSLHNRYQLDEIVRLTKSGEVASNGWRLHLSVDSGMRRLGFCESEIDDVLSTLKENDIKIEGVFSHLRDASLSQVDCFDRMANKAKLCYPNATRHLASSHSLSVERLRYDMVRVGLYAYENAMTVSSVVLSTRRAKRGDIISYGDSKVSKDTNIATIFGGYADGMFGTKKVWIDGNVCPVVGNICMDMFMVDCGEFMPKVGDKVLIFDGKRATSVANDRNCILYKLYTDIGGRVQRIYV